MISPNTRIIEATTKSFPNIDVKIPHIDNWKTNKPKAVYFVTDSANEPLDSNSDGYTNTKLYLSMKY